MLLRLRAVRGVYFLFLNVAKFSNLNRKKRAFSISETLSIVMVMVTGRADPAFLRLTCARE